MANMNTLFKKGYLLAGVVMAANMFVANEVMASENKNETGNLGGQGSGQGAEAQLTQQNNFEIKDFPPQNGNEVQAGGKKGDQKKQDPLDKLLSCENYFNFFGTLALSGANNYFKWWDYNAGSYCNLRIGCLGWRTKKFFDIVQLDFNLNLWRGIGWSIPHIIKFRRSLTKAEKIENNEKDEENAIKSGSNADSWVSFLFKDILRGFVSIHLTLHISKFNFSISISLDSILWEFIIGRFLKETGQQPDKENQFYNNLMDIEKLQETSNNKKDKEKEKEENNENPGTAS